MSFNTSSDSIANVICVLPGPISIGIISSSYFTQFLRCINNHGHFRFVKFFIWNSAPDMNQNISSTLRRSWSRIINRWIEKTSIWNAKRISYWTSVKGCTSSPLSTLLTVVREPFIFVARVS